MAPCGPETVEVRNPKTVGIRHLSAHVGRVLDEGSGLYLIGE